MSEVSFTGRTIAGKYFVEQKLGAGAMGVVYRAHHRALDRPVAVKFIHSELVGHADVEGRFRREAHHASRILHPNVVTIFDFGADEGTLYLIMEYLDGCSLEAAIKREAPFSLARAITISRQIARGLGAAHRQGVVHRDLKPSNIFLAAGDSAAVVKILDFGLAKVFQETDAAHLTKTGIVVGTPKYMSPEHVCGEVTPASDLYSLGLILYEMICGVSPFSASGVKSFIEAHLIETPVSLSQRAPGTSVPPEIEAVVMRSLSKQVTERYQSAREFLDAVDSALKRAGDLVEETASNLDLRDLALSSPEHKTTERQTPITERPARRAAPPLGEIDTTRRPRPRGRQTRLIRLVLTAAVLGLLGVVAYRGSRTLDRTPPRADPLVEKRAGNEGRKAPGGNEPSESIAKPSPPVRPSSRPPRDEGIEKVAGTRPTIPIGVPRLLVFIEEENVSADGAQRQTYSLTQAESAMLKVFSARGIECLDPRTGRAKLSRELTTPALAGDETAVARMAELLGADLVIVGKAVAVNQGSVRGSRFVSSAATVTARIVVAHDGRLLGTESERAVAAELNPITAGGIAIDQAASALADRLTALVEAYRRQEP